MKEKWTDLIGDALLLDNALEEALLTGDEEAKEILEQAREATTRLIQAKSENIIRLLNECSGYIYKLEMEEKIVKARREKYKKKQEFLKGMLLEGMKTLEMKKLETWLGDVSIRKGSKRVEIVDENKIPEEYFKVKTERIVSKNDIKDAIASGLEVAGAKIVTGEDTLSVPKFKE